MTFREFTEAEEKRLREVNPLAEEIIASSKATAENIKNRNRKKFGKILNKTTLGGGFRYPLEALTETTDYLQFTIVEYQPTKELTGGSLVGAPGSRRIGPQGTKDKAKKILGSIILQMPSNIQDGNAVDYGESKMNTLMGAAAGAIGSVINKTGEAVSETLANNPEGAKQSMAELSGDLK